MEKSKTITIQDKPLRDNDCINVYFVKTLGWEKPDDLSGADIKMKRIKSDGSDCETLPLKKIDKDPIANPEDFEGVFVSQGNFEDPKSKTMKHEIGHLLGLRHPWEWKEELQDRAVGEADEKEKSVMLYRGEEVREVERRRKTFPARTKNSGYTRFECKQIEKHKRCIMKIGRKPC